MTVAELIEHLRKLPPDAIVLARGMFGDEGPEEITEPPKFDEDTNFGRRPTGAVVIEP